MQWLQYRAGQMEEDRGSYQITSNRSGTPTNPPKSAVVEVRDQAICEMATRIYYRGRLGPYPANGVAVIRVGDAYAVLGDIRGGEWLLLEIYNMNFEKIGSFFV
jgi:hypothetical protein